MKVVIDVEANGLEKPTEIWCIVCKDIDTGYEYIFRKVTQDEKEEQRFYAFAKDVKYWIGHNLLSYDWPVIRLLLRGVDYEITDRCTDTLIISKMFDYSRPGGHSLEQYGLEFNVPKGIPINGSLIESKHIPTSFYSEYSLDLENYCRRDVDITTKVYLKYLKYITNSNYTNSIILEHRFNNIVNTLSTNGFSFNITKANKLLKNVCNELSIIDNDIHKAFPKRLKLIREVTPRETKHGTISRASIPKALRDILGNDLSCFSVNAPFSFCAWEDFNPSSHKQLVEVLSNAGWKPTDKTNTHKDVEKELSRLKYSRQRTIDLDIRLKELYDKYNELKKFGWKINEQNISTLPESAPTPARLLAKRILLEARRRTLTEWLELANPSDCRIHGKFYSIGAWTHRMAHQNPNTANIPREFKEDGTPKFLGKEMRQLWIAPRNRLLVGVDAEGIQLRIFAHYINDPEFTQSLVDGRKEDGTDPHSLNKRILGSVCLSRQSAKRFIYALLLGAGISKLSEILGCSEPQAREALGRLLERYQGFKKLKEEVVPRDAGRGYFIGLDGRKVSIPGETEGQRKHLCMSGYLQNGEAVVMKKACLLWHDQLIDLKDKIKFVNFVHDEWQTEVPNNMEIALRVAKTQAEAIRLVGEELNLNCPLAGSYYNDDIKDYTIGTNWYATH